MKEQHRKVPFPLWKVHQTYRCLVQSCMRTDTQWQYYMITKVIKNASSQNVTCTKFRWLWLCAWKASRVFSLLGKTYFSTAQWLCKHVVQFLPRRYDSKGVSRPWLPYISVGYKQYQNISALIHQTSGSQSPRRVSHWFMCEVCHALRFCQSGIHHHSVAPSRTCHQNKNKIDTWHKSVCRKYKMFQSCLWLRLKRTNFSPRKWGKVEKLWRCVTQ